MNHITITLVAFGGTAAGSGTAILTPGTALALFRAPIDGYGGGVTLSQAHIISTSGTVSVSLVDTGPNGTSIVGTICTFPSVQNNTPQKGTPADYFLDGGNYMGLTWGAGTVVAPCVINVGYLQGR